MQFLDHLQGVGSATGFAQDIKCKQDSLGG